MEKGQLCYLINSYDIEPVEFIEEDNSWHVHVKYLEKEEDNWVSIAYVCATKEQAYTKLLGWLEDDKLDAEDGIENLEEELNILNEAIRKLKQKYEQ